jgi:hypothetical protein
VTAGEKEWARETREKTRKRMRGVGWEAHVTSRDPTLNAGRAPDQRQYLTCPSELVPNPILTELRRIGYRFLCEDDAPAR